jgi:hypothetical protein
VNCFVIDPMRNFVLAALGISHSAFAHPYPLHESCVAAEGHEHGAAESVHLPLCLHVRLDAFGHCRIECRLCGCPWGGRRRAPLGL